MTGFRNTSIRSRLDDINVRADARKVVCFTAAVLLDGVVEARDGAFGETVGRLGGRQRRQDKRGKVDESHCRWYRAECMRVRRA